MQNEGHLGVSLLVWAPVGATLLAADRAALALVGGATMLALASLPDADVRIPFVKHRGVTHTLGFALAVGAVLGSAGFALADPVNLGTATAVAGFGFAVGTLAVVAHLVGDVLTPMGIAPFWPLSARRYSLGVCRAADPLANWLLLALGVLVSVAVLVVPGRFG